MADTQYIVIKTILHMIHSLSSGQLIEQFIVYEETYVRT